MICQNCQAQVDNDLIFCTNCGERLFESKSEAQTVLIKDSGVTKNSVEVPKKSSSNLKWLALIIALIAIPASIFGVFLLTKDDDNQSSFQNTNKPKTPVSNPTRKPNNNQNSNANLVNTNSANTNTNTQNVSNVNAETQVEKIELMNERIEVAPKTHFARSFEIKRDNAKLIGEIKALEGENIKGFVYLQSQYEEHFPDETYKMFSFDGRKSVSINQTLVAEKYVLIFINDGEIPQSIQAVFSIE